MAEDDDDFRFCPHCPQRKKPFKTRSGRTQHQNSDKCRGNFFLPTNIATLPVYNDDLHQSPLPSPGPPSPSNSPPDFQNSSPQVPQETLQQNQESSPRLPAQAPPKVLVETVEEDEDDGLNYPQYNYRDGDTEEMFELEEPREAWDSQTDDLHLFHDAKDGYESNYHDDDSSALEEANFECSSYADMSDFFEVEYVKPDKVPLPGQDSILLAHNNFLKATETLRNTTKKDGEINGIKLLSVLDKSNAPLYLYDEICKWQEDISRAGTDEELLPDFNGNIPSRKVLLKALIARYDLAGLAPKKVFCYLPGSKKVVQIVIHDFEAALRSLLGDETLVCITNITFDDPTDPTAFNTDDPEVLGEINTGSALRQAHVRYMNKDGNIVTIGIILFIDATVCDLHGRVRLEPISMTLSIFNMATRRKPEAWRTLGYIRHIDPGEKDLSSEVTDPADIASITKQKLLCARDKNAPKGATAHVPPTRRDYHAMIYVIMDGLRTVQKKGGLYWIFNYPGIKTPLKQVLLKFPIVFIIGDTEGHNKIAVLVGGAGTSGDNNLCRNCNTPKKDTDNPDFKFQYISTKKMQQQIRRENYEYARKSLGHYCLIHNGFDEIEFCDEERGLNGALPPEILHFFLLGYLVYALVGLVVMNKLDNSSNKTTSTNTAKDAAGTQVELSTGQSVSKQKEAKKQSRKQSATISSSKQTPASNKSRNKSKTSVARKTAKKDKNATPGASKDAPEDDEFDPEDDGNVGEETVEDIFREIADASDDEQKFRVFSPAFREDVEVALKLIGLILQRQSDRDFPRTFFPSGYLPSVDGNSKGGSKTGKKSASELPGVMLCCLLLLLGSSFENKFDSMIGEHRKAHYIRLFTLLLMLDQWIRQPTFKVSEMDESREFLILLMKKYKATINRKVGMKMCFIKFHLLIHIADDIMRFGSPMNTNSCACESNHKANYKDHASHTQKRADVLELQTSKHSMNRISIRRAAKEPYVVSAGTRKELSEDERLAKRAIRRGPMIDVKWNRCEDGGIIEQEDIEYRPRDRTLDKIQKAWKSDLISFDDLDEQLRTKILPSLDPDTVSFTLFMEYNTPDAKLKVRGHPCWKGGGWHDWFKVETKETNADSDSDGDILEFVKAQCYHVLIFFKVTGITDSVANSSSLIPRDGEYALCHSTWRQNLYEHLEEGYYYYGLKYTSSFANPNCPIVYWDIKHTLQADRMSKQPLSTVRATTLKRKKLPQAPNTIPSKAKPLLKIISTDLITTPIAAIPDPKCIMPHTWLFIQPRSGWKDQMLGMMEIISTDPPNSRKG